MDNHIYDSVSCFERHQLVPLSNNNTGAVTESLIKLIFTGEDIIQTDETGFAYTGKCHLLKGPSKITKRDYLQRMTSSSVVLHFCMTTTQLLNQLMEKSRLPVISSNKCVDLASRISKGSLLNILRNSWKPPECCRIRPYISFWPEQLAYVSLESKYLILVTVEILPFPCYQDVKQ